MGGKKKIETGTTMRIGGIEIMKSFSRIQYHDMKKILPEK